MLLISCNQNDIVDEKLKINNVDFKKSSFAGKESLPAVNIKDASIVQDMTSWMSKVPDDINISKMSIPGTHDSGSYTDAHVSVAIDYTITQSKTIAEQLNAGVRFIDLRVAVFPDRTGDSACEIWHGYFYMITLNTAMKDISNFLKAHPSEFVFVKIKQEYSSVDDKTFIKTYTNYVKPWDNMMYINNVLPTLQSVRGKMVIISNVAGLPGYNYGTSEKNNCIQDNYNTMPKNKTELVKKQFINSISHFGDTTNLLYFNYLNGNKFPTYNIGDYERILLPKLDYYLADLGVFEITTQWKGSFANNDWLPLGIVPMDFSTVNSNSMSYYIKLVARQNPNKYMANYPVVKIKQVDPYDYSNQNTDYLFPTGNGTGDTGPLSDFRRRILCSKVAVSPIEKSYWVKVPTTSGKFLLFSPVYKEFLYASSIIKDNRREFPTWMTGEVVNYSEWDISGQKNATISMYPTPGTTNREYVYESSLDFPNTGNNNREVALWTKNIGSIIRHAYWDIIQVGTTK